MCAIRLFFAFASATAFAHAHADTWPPTGHFAGSGRACAGTLAIREKTVAWNTAFSHCRPRPADRVDEARSGGNRRITYAFTGAAPSCRFQVISLTHDESSGADTGWEATGYADLASYHADRRSSYTRNAPDMMSCALVRDHEQDRRRGRQ